MQHEMDEKQKSKPSPEQATEFLRALADQLEQGKGVWFGQELCFSGEVKLEQRLKSKADKAVLKLKLKLQTAPLAVDEPAFEPADEAEEPATAEPSADETPAEEDDDQKPPAGKKLSYKKLKKLLAEEMKAVKKPLEAGQMPAMELVETFIRDLRLITDYPGKGDEYYPQVNQLADEFMTAVEAQNLEELNRALAGIKELRKNCHDKFK